MHGLLITHNTSGFEHYNKIIYSYETDSVALLLSLRSLCLMCSDIFDAMPAIMRNQGNLHARTQQRITEHKQATTHAVTSIQSNKRRQRKISREYVVAVFVVLL